MRDCTDDRERCMIMENIATRNCQSESTQETSTDKNRNSRIIVAFDDDHEDDNAYNAAYPAYVIKFSDDIMTSRESE